MNDAQQESDEIKFRIATNLGACALAEEDLGRAQKNLEEAYRLQPTNPKAIANAAVVAQVNGDSKRAMDLALKTRELDPRNSQATAVFIGELWNAGKRERLQSLIDEESWIMDDKQCRLVLSRVRMKQSRFDEAVALRRSLVEDDRNDATAHLALSQSLLNFVQADPSIARYTIKSVDLLREARAETDKAVCLLHSTDLRAQSLKARLTRSCANALLGETAEALADLDSVLNEAPSNEEALFNKGKLLLFHEDKPVEARATLEKIQECRLRREAVVPLAIAHINSENHEAAIVLLRDSLTLQDADWEDIAIAELLSRAESAAGKEDSVGPLVEAALELTPNAPRLLSLLALQCEIIGDLDGAENALLKAIQYSCDHDRAELAVRLGSLYRDQLRHSEAADQFSEVIGQVPEHPLAINLLSCLVNSKRLREALEWARKIRGAYSKPPRSAIEWRHKSLGE